MHREINARISNRLIDDSFNRDQSFTLDTKTKENNEKTKTKRLATPSPLPPEVIFIIIRSELKTSQFFSILESRR